MLVSCGRVMLCVAVFGSRLSPCFLCLGTVANHVFTRNFEAIQFLWMDFAVLCVLQAINGLVGWYEESNSSDAIKALRKNLAGVQCETLWPWIVA